MKLHPFMVEAIYLRMHPEDSIVKDDGKEFWYDDATHKYYYINHNAPIKNGIYEARGLKAWWQRYLKQLEEEQENE